MSYEEDNKYREWMTRLAGDGGESPIEALVIGALSTGRGFVLCKEKPTDDWFTGIRVAIVPQHRLKPYRVDIALFFRKFSAEDRSVHGICIECDGQQWHSSPSQVAADISRDKFISIHYRMPVWRYAGHAIHNDLANVADEIEQAVRDYQNSSKPDLSLARMVSGVLTSKRSEDSDWDDDDYEDYY